METMAQHVKTTIRYDGPALVGHEMDVQDLAPALLALADIVQIANRRFNGDRASMKVVVNADVEQRCFMLDLGLVQSLMDQAKGLFTAENIKTAREIAADVGLVAGVTGVGLFQLIAFLAKAKKAPTSETTMTVDQGNGNVTVFNSGSGQITVTQNTFLLAQDPVVVGKAQQVVRPLQKPGYTSLSFLVGDAEVFDIQEDDAAAFGSVEALSEEQKPPENTSTIDGTLRIKSAQYEGQARWGFMWNGRGIDAEMKEAAADWVEKFQANEVYAPPNSKLQVTMTETVKLDDAGNAIGKPSYVVKAVHSVAPPPTQGKLI
jgi:hypothetical protein